MPSIIETYGEDDGVEINYFYPGTTRIPYEAFDRKQAKQIVVLRCDPKDLYTTVLFCKIPKEILEAPNGASFDVPSLSVTHQQELRPDDTEPLILDAASLGVASRQLVLSHCVSMTPN